MIESLWTLFASALISSTLLPGGSEALLVYQLDQLPENWLLILLVATAGNVLGSVITFAIGWIISQRYPLISFKHHRHQRARRLIDSYGVFALLFAWMPIVGDPLCLIAGWLRVNWAVSFLLILVGKLARYAVLVWLTLQVV